MADDWSALEESIPSKRRPRARYAPKITTVPVVDDCCVRLERTHLVVERQQLRSVRISLTRTPRPSTSNLSRSLVTGINCPRGSYCSPGAGNVPCPKGKYSDVTKATGVDFCIPCSPGFYCPDGKIRKSCASGKYSVAGQEACYPCPDSTFCPG